MPPVKRTTELNQTIARNLVSKGEFLVAYLPKVGDPLVAWDDVNIAGLRWLISYLEKQLAHQKQEERNHLPNQFRKGVKR